MNIKIFLWLLAFMPLGLFGQPYYIDPAGDDGTGDGSSGNPWLNVGYAMNQCSAGDTVFAKSGTYNYSAAQTVNVSGSSGSYIVLTSEKGHPDSVTFDFWGYDVSGDSPQSIYGIHAAYDKCLKFEKFSIRRLWNINTDDGRAHALYFDECDSIDINWVYIDSIAGRGILGYKSGAANITNCDFSWLADPQDSDPGNAGTGILWYQTTASSSDTVRVTGCRGWYCADQPFGLLTGNVGIFDSCWSWDNGLHDEGYTSGGGQGFKIGLGLNTDIDTMHIIMKHCISAFNLGYGINTNTSSGSYKMNVHILCNTSYKNSNWGIQADGYTNSTDNNIRIYNNLSFDNGTWDLGIVDSATHYNNSFDAPYTGTGIGSWFNSPATVTIADFQDVPEDVAECHTVLGATRKAGGYLPDLGDHFYPASASDLIDQGLVIKDETGEMAYIGSAPDLGAFEFSPSVEKNFILIDTMIQISTSGDTLFEMLVADDTLYFGAYEDGVRKWWSIYKASGTDNESAHYWRYTFTSVVAPTGIQVGEITTVSNLKVSNDSLIFYVGEDAYPVIHRTVDPAEQSVWWPVWLLIAGVLLNRRNRRKLKQ